jgi:hypothetical protein
MPPGDSERVIDGRRPLGSGGVGTEKGWPSDSEMASDGPGMHARAQARRFFIYCCLKNGLASVSAAFPPRLGRLALR